MYMTDDLGKRKVAHCEQNQSGVSASLSKPNQLPQNVEKFHSVLFLEQQEVVEIDMQGYRIATSLHSSLKLLSVKLLKKLFCFVFVPKTNSSAFKPTDSNRNMGDP